MPNIQISRLGRLRKGFDALDVEQEGEIRVEKFKERIRKVLYILKESHTILIFGTQCLVSVNTVFLLSSFSTKNLRYGMRF